MKLKTILTSALVLTAVVSVSAQAGEDQGSTGQLAQVELKDIQKNRHYGVNSDSSVTKAAAEAPGKTREQVQAELREFQKNYHPNVLTDLYTGPM